MRQPRHDNSKQLTVFDTDASTAAPRAIDRPRRFSAESRTSALATQRGARSTAPAAPRQGSPRTRPAATAPDVRGNPPSDLATLFLANLDEAALDTLAERLAPRLALRFESLTPQRDEWLDARSAAIYLGLTLHALHKHSAARTIPFEQNKPGGKLWFKRDQLDAWRHRSR